MLNNINDLVKGNKYTLIIENEVGVLVKREITLEKADMILKDKYSCTKKYIPQLIFKYKRARNLTGLKFTGKLVIFEGWRKDLQDPDINNQFCFDMDINEYLNNNNIDINKCLAFNI